MDRSSPRLFLCAGLQCSGSTLVSWCFLQRRDMDGVLDGEYDLLPRIAPDLGRPLAWCKTTISSFRLSELMSHYEDEGWTVSPLLIMRDVRDTWASLLSQALRRERIHGGRSSAAVAIPPLQGGLGTFSSQGLADPALRESLGESRADAAGDMPAIGDCPGTTRCCIGPNEPARLPTRAGEAIPFGKLKGGAWPKPWRGIPPRRKKKLSSAAAIWPGWKTSFKRSMQKTAIPFTLPLAPKQMTRVRHRFAIFRNCGGITGSFSENRFVGCSTAWACRTALWTAGS